MKTNSQVMSYKPILNQTWELFRTLYSILYIYKQKQIKSEILS